LKCLTILCSFVSSKYFNYSCSQRWRAPSQLCSCLLLSILRGAPSSSITSKSQPHHIFNLHTHHCTESTHTEVTNNRIVVCTLLRHFPLRFRSAHLKPQLFKRESHHQWSTCKAMLAPEKFPRIHSLIVLAWCYSPGRPLRNRSLVRSLACN
jgi:hypothetical protein